MTAPVSGSLALSQGYVVLAPRSGEAYPIPCEEWEFLKSKLRAISSGAWFFQTLGSALVGASISTGLTVLFTAVTERQAIIAWSAVVATMLCGVLSLVFAHQQKTVQRVLASDVLVQMEIIEKRYERVSQTNVPANSR
jgi:hypothetical protein